MVSNPVGECDRSHTEAGKGQSQKTNIAVLKVNVLQGVQFGLLSASFLVRVYFGSCRLELNSVVL